MDLKLRGKKALITGGTSGIGGAVSLLLAEEGADIGINYSRNDEKALSLMKELEGKRGKAILVKGDVYDYGEVRKIVDKVMKEFSTIDILVHSAGIPTPKEDNIENWNRLLSVHLTSCYNLYKFVSPIMKKEKRGKIIIVSSLCAYTGGVSAYCPAKAGMISFAKGLARELAPYNINVNTVSPGTIFTPMLEPDIPEKMRRKFTEENIPIYKSRKGYPRGEEVAKVILFLSSHMANHITGEDIRVDGGQFIRF